MPQTQNPSPLSQGMRNIRGIKQISRIKAAEFDIISVKDEKHGTMEGYRNREDISTLAPNTLTVGSRDVLTNVFGRVYSRAGYTLDGGSSGLNVGIVSSYDWNTPPSGTVRNLRAGGNVSTGSGYMEVRNVDSTGKVTWNKLLQNLNSVNFNFAPWWNNTQQINEVLMVNGGQQIYDWNGAEATLATVTDQGSSIMSIATSPTAAGSGYVVGDILTISGGTGGTVSVNSIVNGAISSATLNSGGNTYAVNDIVYVGQAGALAGTIKVTGATAGAITSFSIQTVGQGYSVGTAIVAQGSVNGGVNATINITAISNGSIGLPAFAQGNTTPITLLTPGTGYTVASGIATTGGTGTGATVQILSLGTNAITIQGSKTIGQLGFYNDANSHRLIINGQTFSYSSSTSAANSNSFLNVSPDPTTASLTAGMLIMQAPEVTANAGGVSGLPLTSSTSFTNWTNDLILYANYQVFVGCLTNNSVFISVPNSFTTFNGANGNGGTPFILNAPPVGMIVQESNVYISAGKGYWYEIVYTPAAESTTTVSAWTVYPLKTGLKQGVFSQSLMWKMPNDVAFVSNEPVVRTLGRVSQNLATPEMVNLSASIVNDVQNYNFTGGSGKFINENLYIAIPSLGIIRIYNMTAQDEGKKNYYWEAPQTIPLSGFMDAGDGNIYGHSALTSDTYKLFSGSSDNGAQINAVAAFPQITFGDRHKLKSFLKEYVEGYLEQTTTLTCNLIFTGTNRTTTLAKQIMGTNTQITNNPVEAASLGKISLGKNPLGGDLAQTGSAIAPNFAVYLTFQRTPFFKVQPIFSSLGTSQNWQILAMGFNQQTTSEQENAVTI